jgi:hypothetical protein
MNTFNQDLAAAVLLEAVFSTDAVACEKYGITVRTLCNYRKRLHTDSNFADFFRTKKEAFDLAWVNEMPIALRKAIRFIARATEVADPRNPAVIERIAGAIKIIAEVQMTGKFIDARIGTGDRETSQLSRQGDTSPASSLVN